MNPFRVALCFSGQSRTWKFCVNNIKNFFKSNAHPELGTPVQYDIFIHTWDVNYFRKNTKSWDSDIDPFTLQDQEDMRLLYNPIHMEVENFDSFKQSLNQFLAWDPFFYSFMKSVHFKRQYELANDFEYDLVIKVRPDTIYNPRSAFIFHKAEPMIGYSCTPVSKMIPEFHYNNFDDVLFYADSKTMDLIAHTYRIHKVKRLREQTLREQFNQDPEFFYGPGCLLYKTMVDMSIHPYCFNSYPWYVVRRNVEESKLDAIADWDRVAVMCQDWYA